MSLKIGIDFDNTIVTYDELFYRYAVERFGMPTNVPSDKPRIRDHFWASPEGKENWIHLQSVVYGEKVLEAPMADGFKVFAEGCRSAGLDLFVISHKTEHPARGAKINLQDVALGWMEANGMFDGLGFTREHVFFELTRQQKLERIVATQCNLFIDDLPEVLEEPLFPGDVQRILYDPACRHLEVPDVLNCNSWKEVAHVIQRQIA